MKLHNLALIPVIFAVGCSSPVHISDHTSPYLVQPDGVRRAVLHKVPPVYSVGLRSEGVSGTVTLQYSILPDGNVAHIEVMESPDERLSEVSVQALSQWKFEPVSDSGILVMRQKFEFDIKK